MFDFLKAPQPDKAPEAKASAAGRVVAMGGAGRVVWSPRDTASLTRAGFTGNPVGFRAANWDLSPTTIPLVAELGLSYDSSLMADEACYEALQGREAAPGAASAPDCVREAELCHCSGGEAGSAARKSPGCTCDNTGNDSIRS